MTLYVVAKARNSLSSLPTVLAPQAVALTVHVEFGDVHLLKVRAKPLR